jgi:hypothetical protein
MLPAAMATDDPIRTLLAGIDPAPFIWAPKGNVVIMQEKVAEAGADLDEVLAWVHEHGGELDRTMPVANTRRGVSAVPKPQGKPYYVVPQEALGS